MKFLLQNGFCRCYSRVANTSVIHDPTIPEAIHHQEDFHITPYLCSTSPPTILHLTSQLRPRPLPWGPPGMAQALFRFSLTCFVLRWFIINPCIFRWNTDLFATWPPGLGINFIVVIDAFQIYL